MASDRDEEWADRGIAGLRAKGTLYDPGTDIALLMRLPGVIPEGKSFSELIQNIDIAPTILEATGVPIPATMQGKSFWPLLTGGSHEAHEAIVIERNWHGDYDPMRAVRTKRFHYIRNFGDAPKKAWCAIRATLLHLSAVHTCERQHVHRAHAPRDGHRGQSSTHHYAHEVMTLRRVELQAV